MLSVIKDLCAHFFGCVQLQAVIVVQGERCKCKLNEFLILCVQTRYIFVPFTRVQTIGYDIYVLIFHKRNRVYVTCYMYDISTPPGGI